jgi:hypothetical protein
VKYPWRNLICTKKRTKQGKTSRVKANIKLTLQPSELTRPFNKYLLYPSR